MEQFSTQDEATVGSERDRSVFEEVGVARVARLREMVGKTFSPRALALVAALSGAGAIESHTAEAETLSGSYSSAEVHKEASKLFSDALRQAHSHTEFTASLVESLQSKSDDEKLAVLGALGSALGREYDYDMLNANEHVALSDSEIFTALKTNRGTVGICGNIHEYIKRIATSIGLESFTASGTLGTSDGGYGGHAYSMLRARVLQSDGSTKEELVVVNYDSIFPTGTDNMRDAMGAYEERFGSPSFFAQTVSLPSGEMIRVNTPASETLTGLAHMDKSAREVLTDGATHPEHTELGFSVNSHLGTEEIELDTRYFSLSYGHYANPGDQFNSIVAADSVTLGYHSPQGDPNEAGFSMDAKLNFTQADLPGAQSEAVQFAAIELVKGYHSGKNELMTSEEFGNISGQFEAIARFGLALTVNGDKNLPLANRAPSGEADVAMQYTVYIDPNNRTEFYATAGLSGQLVMGDFQKQKQTLRPGQYFVIGLDTEKVDAKVSYATDGVQTDTEASLSALFGKTTFDVSYEASSDFPGDSSETFSIGASKQIGKNGRLTIKSFQADGDKGASLEFVTRF